MRERKVMSNIYRAGQRVRIEVEGTLTEDGRESVLRVLWGNGGGATFAVNGEPVHWVRDADITVLSEPRPDEPTGLGAVVESRLYDTRVWSFVRVYPCSEGPDRYLWRAVDPSAVLSRSFYRWSDLIDPAVRSEGWTP